MRIQPTMLFAVMLAVLVGCSSSNDFRMSEEEEGGSGVPASYSSADSADSAAPAPEARRSPSAEEDLTVREIRAADWLNTDSPVSLANLKGKVVMVEFWATWCGPCIQGIPHLNELQAEFGPEGFQLVSLTDEDRDTVTRFQESRKLEMNYIIGLGSDTLVDYNVRGIPHALVIGRDGKMVWRGHPMNPECEAHIRGALAQ
jgi:thiol-disulfide isomerase/thioredoxin